VLQEQGRRADLKIGHYISKPGAITRSGFGMTGRGIVRTWGAAVLRPNIAKARGTPHVRSGQADGVTERRTQEHSHSWLCYESKAEEPI
jgi:hypothetical protein